jgi:hypothetical protein
MAERVGFESAGVSSTKLGYHYGFLLPSSKAQLASSGPVGNLLHDSAFAPVAIQLLAWYFRVAPVRSYRLLHEEILAVMLVIHAKGRRRS